jgi:hypothetical protein
LYTTKVLLKESKLFYNYDFFTFIIMKRNRVKQAKRIFNLTHPENKDDLDSRPKEEQHFKGDNVTHNKKENRKPGKQK